MRILKLMGAKGSSTVFLGSNLLEEILAFCKKDKTVIITDKNVDMFYGDKFSGFKKVIIEGGEKNKTSYTAWDIYNTLLKFGCERNTFILGIGGGVVCDMTGFVASTYLRGLSFGFVATTLLAQVDAAIGGKNGVNFNGYKNIIGTINQPEFVICDLSTLKTLPRQEIKNGMAEVIKHALIADRRLFLEIEKNRDAFITLDLLHIEPLIFNSMKVKIEIVSKDETEKNERRKLNFGHTFGHAIELSTGVSHGEAVSIGMVMEANLSISRGLLQPYELEQIKALLAFFDLPVEIHCHQKDKVMDAIMKDKKKEGDYIYSVLINGIGHAVIEKVKIREIREILYDMCKS
ncbi:MAG: 3-dehydroquinate synthase [Syntrophorhabdaceae bacterium]|nr:3-dehydroquinate synthase [Syntrophorhabdaceae bacterium]